MRLTFKGRNLIKCTSSCITVIVFDDNSPKTNDESAHLSLNGEGRMRYFDKSAQAIFFANGRMGNNAEHTPYDAPPTAHHGFSFVRGQKKVIFFSKFAIA